MISATTYNLFVSWFSEYATHYGNNPRILKFRKDEPLSKAGVTMASRFYTPDEALKVRRLWRPCCWSEESLCCPLPKGLSPCWLAHHCLMPQSLSCVTLLSMPVCLPPGRAQVGV
jgi:hypothetical protein